MNKQAAPSWQQKTSLPHEPLMLHRVDASQLQAPVHVAHGRVEELPDDDEDTPMTRMEFGALLLLGVVSWSVVGALIYGAVKLAEVLR